MPTGYTGALYEGEQSFADFVLGCARGMGVAILMRDSPADEPISIEAITDDSEYHARAIREAKEELARLNALTPDEVAAEARAAYRERVEFEASYKMTRLAMRKRYEDMLAQVREWEPPSAEHETFKQFMIDQLAGSIDFDTSDNHFRDPVEQPPEKWLAEKIERSARDIAYHTEEEQKRIERNEGRVRWVNQLRESLGLEALTPA